VFSHAVDLIKYIREQYGDYFDIGVAGYPEGHPEAPDLETDVLYLKQKIDAGATFVITQMFYDVDNFLEWVALCRALGVRVPIIPGIMPITSWTTLLRRTRLMQTRIPPNFLRVLEPIKDDDAAVREIGTKLVAGLCRKILESGILQLHFYTMNLEKATFMILEKLEITTAMNLKNPLPWRQVNQSSPSQVDRSVSHMEGRKRMFVQYFGRIATRATSHGLKSGTNSPTADGETHGLLRTGNSTCTVLGSNAPPTRLENGGDFPLRLQMYVISLQITSSEKSSISLGVTARSVLKSPRFGTTLLI